MTTSGRSCKLHARSLQNKYNVLTASSDVPITLHSDLVRIAKLARLGQEGIRASVKQCCTGASASPFAVYTTSLEDLITKASVNVSAIASAVAGSGASSGPTKPSTKLSGRLLNNGGIKDCKVGQIKLCVVGSAPLRACLCQFLAANCACITSKTVYNPSKTPP
jgi:hypothetical protein